jgi:anaerobic magnesium-protoporphyrin IX monomethyl ester cyclase
MADAGMKWVFLGIENSSDSTLDSMNKRNHFDKADTFEVIKELKANRIIILGGFILGNPDENEESFWENFEFAKQLKVDLPIFNTITPYPKTPIRAELQEMGLITNPDDYTRYDCWEVNIKTKHLTTAQIDSIRNKMNTRFPIESGSLLNLTKEFPFYITKLILKWLVVKPSDVIKFFFHGFSKRLFSQRKAV